MFDPQDIPDKLGGVFIEGVQQPGDKLQAPKALVNFIGLLSVVRINRRRLRKRFTTLPPAHAPDHILETLSDAVTKPFER